MNHVHHLFVLQQGNNKSTFEDNRYFRFCRSGIMALQLLSKTLPSYLPQSLVAFSWFIHHGWSTPFRRNGVRNDLYDWFASINATGSQWRKGCNQFSTENWVNLTYHGFMHIIISPWKTIELCLIFRWDVPTEKRHIVTLEVKNLTNNRKKQKFRILTTIDDSDGHLAAGIYPYSYLAHIDVDRSPMLPLISEWFPISSTQKCSRFATTKFQIRNERKSDVTGSCWFFQHFGCCWFHYQTAHICKFSCK